MRVLLPYLTIMIITREEAERRVKNSLHVNNGRVVQIAKPVGRRPDNLPAPMRELIGTLGRLDTIRNVAKEFGTGKSNVQSYARGMVGGTVSGRVDEELRDKIDHNCKQVQEKATDKLLLALDLISPDKLQSQKPKDLSAIARDLSIVADRARPRGEVNISGSQVIVYAPQQREEKSYDVIEA